MYNTEWRNCSAAFELARRWWVLIAASLAVVAAVAIAVAYWPSPPPLPHPFDAPRVRGPGGECVGFRPTPPAVPLLANVWRGPLAVSRAREGPGRAERHAAARAALHKSSGSAASPAPGPAVPIPSGPRMHAADAICAPFQPRPRIAVCISGMDRTFMNPAIHLSQLQYYVEALGHREGVDVFFSLRVRHDAGASQNRTFEAHLRELERVVDLFDPAGVEVEVLPEAPRPHRDQVGNPACTFHKTSAFSKYSPSLLESLLAQYTSLASCYRMVQAREDALGFTYDYLSRARADLFFGQAVPPWCSRIFDPHAFTHARFDYVSFIPRCGGDVMLNLLGVYASCRGKLDGRVAMPEAFMSEAVEQAGFEVKSLDSWLRVVLAREKTDAGFLAEFGNSAEVAQGTFCVWARSMYPVYGEACMETLWRNPTDWV